MSGKDAQAHFDRGEAHLQRSEYNKAIADFDVAISLDDRCSLAYGMRGQAHYLTDEYTKAIADCNRAIDLPRIHRRGGVTAAGWAMSGKGGRWFGQDFG